MNQDEKDYEGGESYMTTAIDCRVYTLQLMLQSSILSYSLKFYSLLSQIAIATVQWCYTAHIQALYLTGALQARPMMLLAFV